jgi:hypothetical protein
MARSLTGRRRTRAEMAREMLCSLETSGAMATCVREFVHGVRVHVACRELEMLLVGVEEEMGIPAQSCPSNHSSVVDSATPNFGVSQPMSREATPTPQRLMRVDKTSRVDLI